MRNRITTRTITAMIVLALIAAVFALPLGAVAAEDMPVTLISTERFSSAQGEDGINYYIDLDSPSDHAAYGSVSVFKLEGDVLLVKNGAVTTEIKRTADYNIKQLAMDERYVYILCKPVGSQNFEIRVYDHMLDKNLTFGEFVAAVFPTHGLGDDTVGYIEKTARAITCSGNKLYIASLAGLYSLSAADGFKPAVKGDPMGYIGTMAGTISLGVRSSDKIYALLDNGIYVKNAAEEGDFSSLVALSENTVTSMTVGDDLIYYVSGKQVFAADAVSGEVKGAIYSAESPISAISSAVSDGVRYIYVTVSSENRVYKLRETAAAPYLELYNYYGTYGDGDGRMHDPTSVTAYSGGKVYVCDYSNSRLLIKTREGIYSVTSEQLGTQTPYLVATDKSGYVYVLDTANKLTVFADTGVYGGEKPPLEVMSTADLSAGTISDIHFDTADRLYIAYEDGRVTYMDDGTQADLLNVGKKVKAIYTSYNAETLYAAYEHTVQLYDIDTARATGLSVDTGAYAVNDIAVDYNGNLFALTDGDNGCLLRYSRTREGYSLSAIMRDRTLKLSSASQLYADRSSGKIYIANKGMHTVMSAVKTSTGYKTEDDSHYAHPTSYDLIKAAKVSADALVYASPDNFEQTVSLPANGYFLALCEHTYAGEQFYYGVTADGYKGYLPTAGTTLLPVTQDTALQGSGSELYPLFESVKIYSYPEINAPLKATLKKDKTLKLIDNVAYDNDAQIWQTANVKWLCVSYKNAVGLNEYGYVKMSDVTRSGRSEVPTHKTYLKVKSSIGHTVNMYSEPNETSSVLFSLTDGTLVQLADNEFDPESSFTKVIYNDTVGYIPTSFLQRNTLTTGQTIAIIVSVISVLVTAIVILLIVRYNRQRKRY